MVHVIIIKQIGHGGRVVGWHNSKQQFAGSNPPTAGFFSLKKAQVLVFNCNSSLQRTVCVSIDTELGTRALRAESEEDSRS